MTAFARRLSGRLTGVLSFALLALALFAPAALAQQSVDVATISGRVTDPSGAAVPGAQRRSAPHADQRHGEPVTDSEGRFRFPYLRVGPYEIMAKLAGFSDVTRQLTLTAGSAFELPVVLVGRRPRRQRHRHGRGDGARSGAQPDRRAPSRRPKSQSLPLNGRNFLDLALLVPGRRRRPTSAARSSSPRRRRCRAWRSRSAASATSRTTSSSTGCRPTTTRPALSGIPYGVDAVEQFQVVTSGGQAELGRALGGYVNVVTKSGTNTLRGDASTATSATTRFNAPNALSGTTLPMDQQQYGASLGGPIVANRTFYFANVEQRRLDQTGLVDDRRRQRRRRSTRGWPRSATAGRAVATGIYPNPGRHDQRPRQGRSPVQRPRSVQRPLQPLRRRRRTTRAAPAA